MDRDAKSLTQVGHVPRRMLYGAIGAEDGQCAYVYAGIEERCQNEAVAFAYRNGGDFEKVEMCEKHVRPEDRHELEE